MTVEEAESIVFAAEVGMFHGTRGELAMAVLELKAHESAMKAEGGK